MITKRKMLIVILLMAILLVLMVQPLYATQNSKEIKIAALYEMTGSTAFSGLVTLGGVQVAVDIINSKYPEIEMEIAQWEGIPNLRNAKIKLLTADTRGNPALAADLTKKMIKDEGVVAVIGCRISGVTKAASAVAEKYGVPFVCGASTAPSLNKRGFKWFWRTTPDDSILCEDAFKLLEGLTEGKVQGVGRIPKEEINNIAVICENTEWGADNRGYLEDAANSYDYHVVESFLYPHESPDLSSEIQKIISSKANTYLFVPYLSDAILWIKSLRSINASPRIIWGQDSGFMFQAFADAVGKDCEGVLTRSFFPPVYVEKKKLAKEVNEIFKEKEDIELDGSGARSFIAMQALAHALNQAASTDPKALQKALNELYIGPEELITPYEGVKFNENGINMLGHGFIAQWQKGRLEIVYPFDLASADMIYPFPGWK